jgi:O-antigen/teichoic acid export membrane protein
MLFLGAVSGAQAGALSGFEAFKHLSKVNFIAGLATLPLMVGGVLLGGVHGVVWGLIVSMGLNCLLNRRAIRIEARRVGVPLRYDGWMSEWRGVWKFSLMATLSGVVVTPATWACNAILVNQPGGYGELGVYNAVVKIKQVPEMILMTVLNPLLPMLSEQFARNDGEAYGKTLSAAYVISGLIMIPGAFLVIYVPGLALLPFGTSYSGNAGLVQWLFVHAIMVGLFSSLSNVLASTNTMGLGFAYNLVHALLLLAFSALIVPTHLGAGLAISLCLATVVAAVPCVVLIFRRYRHFLGSFPLGLMSSLFIPAGIGSLWVSTLLQTPAAVLVGLAMAILSIALLVRVSRYSLS